MARRFRILVCRGPECGDRRGSAAIHAAFSAAIAAERVVDRCELDSQSCFGRCTQGPNVLVRELADTPAAPPRFALADLPPGRGGGPRLATALYSHVDPTKAAAIVAGHVVGGRVVAAYLQPAPLSTPPVNRPPVPPPAPAASPPPAPEPSGERDV